MMKWGMIAVAFSLLAACMGKGDRHAYSRAATTLEPTAPLSFVDYQRETLVHLQAATRMRPRSPGLDLNAPREWRPVVSPEDGRPSKGMLLVHGLGDSPWSFHDVAEVLAAQGFVVRTVLLPGHGTHPADLLDVRLEEWRRVVQEQVEALQGDVAQVYLGGFSTGANLVLEVAYATPDVAGLALFSPAFRSNTGYDWLTPWISWARPWLFDPQDLPVQNAVRYLNVPTNGFAQFYRSSSAARRLLRSRTYERPVFMVVAEHDSVLDTVYLLNTFQTRFTHPASRLIWYGNAPKFSEGGRILIRDDTLPQQRISQFSHMGILFAPDNALYGESGSLRICWNGQSEEGRAACEDGAPVWYSDWGYQEQNKVHARLTFNPYFAWQGQVMMSVLDAGVVPETAKPGRVEQTVVVRERQR